MENRIQELIRQTRDLNLIEKIQLIQHLTSEIEVVLTMSTSKKSLYGLWEGCSIGEEEIEEAREEIWKSWRN